MRTNISYIIFQKPNIPLLGWLLFFIAAYIVKQPETKDVLYFTANTFLVVWAILEIFQGVNIFRRLLGSIILVLLILRATL